MNTIKAILVYAAATVWLGMLSSGVVLMAMGSQQDNLYSWQWTAGLILIGSALFIPFAALIFMLAYGVVQAVIWKSETSESDNDTGNHKESTPQAVSKSLPVV